MYTPIHSDSHKQCVSHIFNTHRMSINDVTSGILAPALQVKRIQKQKPYQNLWRRSQANKNRCVGIFKRRDIIFNRLHFPILIKFMLCDTSWTNTVHDFFICCAFLYNVIDSDEQMFWSFFYALCPSQQFFPHVHRDLPMLNKYSIL